MYEERQTCRQKDRTRLREVVVPRHTAVKERDRGEIGPQEVEWRECQCGREVAVVPRVNTENRQDGDGSMGRWALSWLCKARIGRPYPTIPATNKVCTIWVGFLRKSKRWIPTR